MGIRDHGRRELIGREVELGRILAHLSVSPASGCAVLIEGPAGVGKTTLWKAALETTAGDTRILQARPAESDTELSFSAVCDLISPLMEGSLAALPDPQQRAVEVIFGLHDDDLPNHRILGLALVTLLRDAARREPVLLAIDDVQWMDRSSRRMLSFALRRLSEVRVNLIATERNEGTAGVDVLDLATTYLEPGLLRLEIGPLSVGALNQLLQTRLGLSLRRPALVRLVEMCGGNPMFALQIARQIVLRGGDTRRIDEIPLPTDLQDMVRMHLRVPAAAEKALLVIASTPAPTPGIVEATLGKSGAEQLDAALDTGVVALEGDRIRFTHPLFASVISTTAPAGKRRSVHRRLANVVTSPEEKARHIAKGFSSPDAEAARDLAGGALSATRRGAIDEAAELYESAAHFTPDSEPIERLHRTVASVEAHISAGDLQRAASLLDEIDRASLAGSDLAKVLWLRADISYHRESFAEAARLLREALLGVQHDPIRVAELHVFLCWPSLSLGELGDTMIQAEKAIRAAKRVGRSDLLSEALAVGEAARFALTGGFDRGRLEEALALEDDETRIPVVAMRPSFIAASIYGWLGEYARARTILESLREGQLNRGEDSVEYTSRALLDLAVWFGDHEAAESFYEDCALAALEPDDELAQGIERYGRAAIAAYAGDLDTARSLVLECLEIFRAHQWQQMLKYPLSVLAFTALSEDEPGETDEILEAAVERQVSLGLPDPAQAPFMADHIESIIVLGQLDTAERLIDLLEERARTLERDHVLATALRCRALLAAARRDAPSALDLAEDALRHHPEGDRPGEIARSYLVQGRIARRAKRWGVARQALGTALRLFEEVGMRVWADKASGELSRVGGRRPATSEMSETERKVAEKLAEGMTTREVAEALYLSERSVQDNIDKAKRKVGARSRAELVAKLSEAEKSQAPR